MKVLPDGAGALHTNERGQFGDAGAPDVFQTAKVAQQAVLELRPDAGNGQQFGIEIPQCAALAVEGDGEAVGFIPDGLDEMQQGNGAPAGAGRIPDL